MTDDDQLRGILGWARSGPLVRWFDGLWRGLGAQRGDDDFDHEDVQALIELGVLEKTPEGARLKPPPAINGVGQSGREKT